MPYADIFAGILVGGRGTRMGEVDKARLPRANDGATFLDHLVRTLRPEVAEVRLSGRAEQSYPETDALLVPDQRADAGPLGGLESLLTDPPAPWCFLIACDLPDFDVGLLHTVAKARQTGARAIVLESDRGVEPTCSLYHRDLLPGLREALDADRRAVHQWLGTVEHLRVRSSDDLAPALRNVNQPGD